jgi:hypothetical protein
MGVGAAIGAIGSIGSAAISASASESAARTAAGAANNAAGLQAAQHQQTVDLLNPFVSYGQKSSSELQNMQNDPGAQLAALQQAPGYQFALDQGLKSTQSGYAARGLGTSGAALKGAASYAEGLAQQTYQQNVLQPLQYQSSLGENAAALVGNANTSYGQSAGNLISQAGQFAGAGQAAQGQALGQGLSGLSSNLQNAQLYSLINGMQGNTNGIGGSSNSVGTLPSSPTGFGNINSDASNPTTYGGGG